jgi:hypothetical protein
MAFRESIPRFPQRWPWSGYAGLRCRRKQSDDARSGVPTLLVPATTSERWTGLLLFAGERISVR